MLHGYKDLENLDLYSFNTQNITNSIFYECCRIENLDVSNFHSQNVWKNVTDMGRTFYICKSIKNLYVSKFII